MVTNLLTIGVIVQSVALLYFIYNTFAYRKLCIQLTENVKAMYCNEEGCTYLKYNTTPVDGTKGIIAEYCSIHLVEHVAEKSA